MLIGVFYLEYCLNSEIRPKNFQHSGVFLEKLDVEKTRKSGQGNFKVPGNWFKIDLFLQYGGSMKSILVKIFVGLVAIIAGILIVASFQPAEFHVERSVTTSATVAEIYAVTSDIKRFPEWSPWQKMDPNSKNEFGGESGAPGSFMAWDGNDKVGSGRMTVTSVQPPTVVNVLVEFFNPYPGTGNVTWKIEDSGLERKVIWSMDGKNESLIPKAFCMIVGMDNMIGKDFSAGLTSLKEIVEQRKN